ncbi:MAG: sulfatase-like hydrolase/transferase [Geminicoccaceae bacterium]
MSENRKNVLLIMADQWPARLMGASGHPFIQTPTLDQLARNGVRYTNAYSECPICIPARRTLMTGTTTRRHGDRVFGTTNPMPGDLPTLAGTFSAAGYQTHAVGKLHVYPPRDRIGFDDVQLCEEGRPHLGSVDDYDIFLSDRGHTGRQYAHGMSNNNYMHRPWHLDEASHVTNWASEQMCRTIKRRDPTRPAFWYLSYTPPHPPLIPLGFYMKLYRQLEMDEPLSGDWSRDSERLPRALQMVRNFYPQYSAFEIADIRRAFYALCTHIDHQLRIVFGTLREEGLLDDTIIMFTTDHGDMLGDHGLLAKRTYYESSANVPMILAGPAGDGRIGTDRVDDRLVGLQDVMPTLLTLAGIDVPPTCEGMDMTGDVRREVLYGDCLETAGGSRMVRDARHKLIWYPAGNVVQLFDLIEDPLETRDLGEVAEAADVRARLETTLVRHLWGHDLEAGWVRDGRLVGFDPGAYTAPPDRSFSGQRGIHFPEPPQAAQDKMVGFPQ